MKFSNKDYIKYPCPVCGATPNPTFKVKENNILLYVSVCPNDGLIFLNPRWTIKQYVKYYADEFDRTKRKGIFKKKHSGFKKFNNRTIRIDKCLKDLFISPKSIIDIGAGNGMLLDFFKTTYDIDTYFIEPSIECKKQMESRDHTSVDFGTDKKFDLLISSHVVEHVDDPIKYLNDVRSLMHDDSIFHICFPDSDNMVTGWFQVPHIYYFNKKIFDLMIKIIGLDIIEHDVYKTELWYTLKKCDPCSKKIEGGSKREEQIKKIIDSSKIKKQKIKYIGR